MHLRTIFYRFHADAHAPGASHTVGCKYLPGARIGLKSFHYRHRLGKDGCLPFELAFSRRTGILPYKMAANFAIRSHPCQTTSVYGILCHSYSAANQARMSDQMSKVCVVCGKKPSFGNNRSHSMRATPRRWDPNVQKVRIQIDGKITRAYVCAKCLKAHKIEKVA